MDVYECIKSRRSIRKFKDKPVEWEKIIRILDSGRLAPSAGNLQNWKFIMIKDEKNRKKIAEAALKQRWMETAPVHIVICAQPEKASRFYGTRGERLYTTQNCAAATQNMLLTAHSLGLGACWVGAFDEEMVRRATSLPEEAYPHAIVAIGYPNETPPMPPKARIEHVSYLETWWNKRRIPPQGWYSLEVMKAAKRGTKFLQKVADKIKSPNSKK